MGTDIQSGKEKKKRVDKIMEERLKVLNPELVNDPEKPLREFLDKKAELKSKE
jgi:hypothetical protein